MGAETLTIARKMRLGKPTAVHRAAVATPKVIPTSKKQKQHLHCIAQGLIKPIQCSFQLSNQISFYLASVIYRQVFSV
jgi:hypothetical protein